MNFLLRLLMKKLSFFLIIILGKSIYSQNSDLDIIKNRISYSVEIETTQISKKRVKYYLTNYNKKGYWEDINYESTSISDWETIEHLNRCMSLIIFLKNNKSEKLHYDIKILLSSALKYWIDNDLKSQNNWWYNEVKIPQLLTKILLLDSTLLESQDQFNVLRVVSTETKSRKGQNFLNLNYSLLNKATYIRDTILLREVAVNIEKRDSQKIRRRNHE